MPRLSVWVLIAVSVVCACAKSAEPAPPDAGSDATIEDAAIGPIDDPDGVVRLTHSGSRLSVITLGAPFGEARAPLRIYDEELQVTCTVELASDGVWRCIPIEDEVDPIGYADAECSSALYESWSARACYGETRWVREVVEGRDETCGAAMFRAFPLEAVETPETILDAECERTTSVQPNVFVFARGDELEPSELVELVRTEVEIENGLRVEVLQAEDGTRIASGLIDPKYGPCAPHELRELGVRCVQHGTAYGPGGGTVPFWTDRGCMGAPLAVSYQSPACSGPDMVFLLDDGSPWSLAHVERLVTGTFYEEGETCTERHAAELSHTYARIGAPFEDHELPRMGMQELRSEGLAMPYYTSEHGVLLAAKSATAFIDLERDAPCHAERTTSGEYRCIPDFAEAVLHDDGYFADPVCSQRLGATFEDPPPSLFALFNDDPCGDGPFQDALMALLETGPRVVADVYELVYTGGTPDHICRLVDEPSLTFFHLGDDVLDDMPLLVERKE